MNNLNTCLVASFLSAAMLFTTAVQAIEIRKFDTMAQADQIEFVGDLVVGAQKVLRDAGRLDQAERVHKLFTEIPKGDEVPLGLAEFDANLALARVADARRVQQNPNAPPLEVEHAMIVTLKKNGIVLPPSFMYVADDFHPKLPPRTPTSAPPNPK
jgi:hypothetical protein